MTSAIVTRGSGRLNFGTDSAPGRCSLRSGPEEPEAIACRAARPLRSRAGPVSGSGPASVRRSVPRSVQRRLARLCAPSADPGGDATPEVDAELAAAAGVEGLAPLLGSRLDQGTLAAADPRTAAELTQAFHRCLSWTLFANVAIRELVEGLRGAGIPALALKGWALIRTVLRPGERPMTDIDLLVPPSAAGEARRIAASVGATVFDPFDRPITAAHDYALPLKTRDGLLVEVHRYLCERPLFQPDYEGPGGMFARAQIGTDGVLVPDLVDLLIGLAIHATHHGYHLPLRAIVDGLLVGARPELDLSVLVRRATAWRATRTVGGFLWVLREFGFDRSGLDVTLRELGAPSSLTRTLVDAPWPEHDTHKHEWRRRLRVARLLDTRSARIGYFAHRVALRGADALWNRYLRLKGAG